MTLLLLAAAAAVAGYAAGRARPGRATVYWATRHIRTGGAASPRFWIGAAIVVVALAAVWLAHPRRSYRNVRDWRQAGRRAPAPRLDPDWAAHRSGTR